MNKFLISSLLLFSLGSQAEMALNSSELSSNKSNSNQVSTVMDSSDVDSDAAVVRAPIAESDNSKLSAHQLLQQMNQASQDLDYEMSYVLIQKNSIEPLLYRHARYAEQHLAHLVYLSGPLREVIRRGNEVSYIEPGVDPFSIESSHMVAPLMPMLDSDVQLLSTIYDFVLLGRAREAGAACQVVRVVPKDGQRYSYIVWIDERSKLPLRADLVDRSGEVIEQYRTISYAVNSRIATVLSSLNDVRLPKVLTMPKDEPATSDWRVRWVPDGFKPNDLNRYRLAITQQMVESQMYSDGLFEFSIYVSELNGQDNQGHIYRQGRRTLHTFIKDNREISVIGDIPPSTAKRIADSISFQSAN